MIMSRRALPVALILAVGLVVPATPLPARAAPTDPGGFRSSLEPGDPQPTWTNTAEVDPSGRKRMSGVTGSPVTGIPGNITDRATEVTGSGENPPNEIAARVVDQNVSTKWLVFASTGWIRVRLDAPVAVVHYALTSANDSPERDPRDWALQGSADGQNWTTLDTRTGQEFTERFQTKEYRFENSTAYPYYRLDITAIGEGNIVQLRRAATLRRGHHPATADRHARLRQRRTGQRAHDET